MHSDVTLNVPGCLRKTTEISQTIFRLLYEIRIWNFSNIQQECYPLERDTGGAKILEGGLHGMETSWLSLIDSNTNQF